MFLCVLIIFGLFPAAVFAEPTDSESELSIPSEGLDLWLKADAGVTADVYGRVSAWADQSGKGNHVTQNDPAFRPLFVTDAEYTTNHQPTIKFEEGFGTTPFLQKTLDEPYEGSSSIVMVIKQNTLSPGDGKGIFGTDLYTGQDMTGTFGVITDWEAGGLLVGGESGNARVTTPSTDYKVIVVTIDVNEGIVKSYVNGILVSEEINENHKLLNKYAAYAIGRSYWWNSLDSSLSELAVYHHVLSDTDRENIEQYLNGKYAIYEETVPTPMLPIPSEGLNLWLKADAGVTADVYNKVSVWADQSGNGNDVTQSDPALQPLRVTDDEYTINDLPAIKFEEGSGTTPFLQKALDTPYEGSSSIVMVMKQNTLSPGAGKGILGTDIYSGQDMTGAFGVITDWDGGGLLVGGEAGNARVATPSTEYNVIVVTIDVNEGIVKSYVNGMLVSEEINESHKQLNKYAAYAIGRSYWHNSLNASLSELAVYRNVLNEADRVAIETYLNNKYEVYKVDAPPVTSDGLNLWLKADVGVIRDANNKVSVWEDQSGHGNDLTQTNPGFQPLLIMDEDTHKPAIQFEQGIGDTPYLSKEFEESYRGSSSIIMVMKQNVLSPGEGKGIFGTGLYKGQDLSEMQGVFGVITDWGSGGILLGGERANALLQLPSTEYSVISATIDTTTGTVKSYVNGSLLTYSTKDKHKQLIKHSAYTVGRSYWWNSLDANVSELLVYRNVIEDTDRSQIENYLIEKYGIEAGEEPVQEPKYLPEPTSKPSTTTHSAEAAFGAQQGTDGWYYMQKSGSTYSYLPDYSTEDPAIWKDASGHPSVGRTFFHPSNTSDAVKKWVAPRAGNIDISGVIQKTDSRGDGVEASVFKNTTLLWGSAVTSEADVHPTGLTDIHVEAGDVIYFVVQANGSMDYDETLWNPEITLNSVLFLEAESYNSASSTRKVASADGEAGEDVYFYGLDYLVYKDVDLSGGFKSLEARLSALSTGGQFEVRLDSISGPVISEFTVANTDSWNHYETQAWSVDPSATGIHDLYIKAVSGVEIARINWFRFTNDEPRGATMPYRTYEAEDGSMGGGATLDHDSQVKVTSSGKSYVHLDATGEYVEWNDVRDANRLLLRYSIPQHTSGTISLYINGVKKQDLHLTSTYNYDSLNPAYGRRYDEKDFVIDIHAGDTIKLQKDAGDSLAWYAIDLIDLETAPVPLEMPDHFLSVKDFGAIGDGVADDTIAIQDAVDAASEQGKGVWFPAGTYNQSSKIQVPSGVNIQGAGIWYSHLHSTVSVPATDWGGKVGFMMNNHSTVSDLRISGIETNRDGESAIVIHTSLGAGKHLTLQNLWVEHVGAFYGWTDLEQSLIQDVRIRSTYFDGIHFGDGGNQYNLVHNNSMRGLGDDAIAQVNLTGIATIATHNVGQFNTISALYWGRGLSDVGGNHLIYRDNIVDSIFNAGMIITTEPVTPNSDSYPIQGLKFQRNTISKSGHLGHNHAGLHFWLYESPMRDVRIELNIIEKGETEGIHIDDTNYGDSEGRTQFNFNTIVDNELDSYNNASSLIQPVLNGNTGLQNNRDKTDLNKAILDALALYESAVEGEGVGQYSAGSMAVLKTALDAAIVVSHQALADQTHIQSAQEAITLAVQTFRSQIKQGEPSEEVTSPSTTPAPAPTSRDQLGTELKDGTAHAEVSMEELERALQAVQEDESGVKSVIMKLEPTNDAYAYVLNLPANAFSEQANHRIVMETEIGTVSFSSEMLANMKLSSGDQVGIHIGLVDLAIGDKPIIELHVMVNGERVSWNNPAEPVTVSVPYEPALEELENPEHIVILYIDDSGNTTPISNSRYHNDTDEVVFTTTHFSKFAVAYNKKSFLDLSDYSWANKQIEVLASKGIIIGVSDNRFDPSISITRADAVLLLMRALDFPLLDGEGSSFTDVQADDYYYEAVAAAESLGIINGVSDQTFDPSTAISRQDMMLMIHRALSVGEKEQREAATGVLNGYRDKDQIASYALASISSLVESGVVIGHDNQLNPTGKLTRAEAAVLIYRVYSLH